MYLLYLLLAALGAILLAFFGLIGGRRTKRVARKARKKLWRHTKKITTDRWKKRRQRNQRIETRRQSSRRAQNERLRGKVRKPATAPKLPQQKPKAQESDVKRYMCSAKTLEGHHCLRYKSPGSNYCWQHAGVFRWLRKPPHDKAARRSSGVARIPSGPPAATAW
jgi:hypothetical protein